MLWYLGVLALLAAGGRTADGSPEVITDGNFSTSCLQGEWMLEFYAPWCSACRAFASSWDEFAKWASDKEVRVGAVDVTKNAVTAGRFMIAALPTVVHLKEGRVRPYTKKRSVNGLKEYVELKLWQSEEPYPWWGDPASVLMHTVGLLYWGSQELSNSYEKLTREYDIPVFVVICCVVVVTLLLGCLVGGMLVCLTEIIGWFYPSSSQTEQTPPGQQDQSEKDSNVDDKKVDGKKVDPTAGEESVTEEGETPAGGELPIIRELSAEAASQLQDAGDQAVRKRKKKPKSSDAD